VAQPRVASTTDPSANRGRSSLPPKRYGRRSDAGRECRGRGLPSACELALDLFVHQVGRISGAAVDVGTDAAGETTPPSPDRGRNAAVQKPYPPVMSGMRGWPSGCPAERRRSHLLGRLIGANLLEQALVGEDAASTASRFCSLTESAAGFVDLFEGAGVACLDMEVSFFGCVRNRKRFELQVLSVGIVGMEITFPRPLAPAIATSSI